MAGGKIDILVNPDLKTFPGKLEAGLRGSLGTATKIGASIGAALGGAATVKSIATLGVEFDKQMNTMAAVSQATGDQLDAVSAKARELGKSADLTATSAGDAAAAMTELVKGGFSVAEAMDAAKGTLQLASAAQIDAASAATIQSQALQAFGLDASYAATASDVLAGAANASSAEIEGIAQGLQQSGAVAHQFGLSIEDTSSALAMFANAGIQGSDAGTLLKSALLALTDQGKPAQSAIEELGLTVYDAQGKFIGMEQLFGQLADASHRMTDEQYQAATATLFGSDAMRLAGVAAGKGAEGWRETYKAVTRAGQASEVAAAQAQGLPGVLEAIENQAEDTGLAIYDAFSDLALDAGGALIKTFEAAGPKIEQAAGSIAGGLERATPAVERIAGVLGSGLKDLGASLGVVAGAGVRAVSALGGAMVPAADGALRLSESVQNLHGPLLAATAALAVGKWQGWGEAVSGGVEALKRKRAATADMIPLEKSLAAMEGKQLSTRGAMVALLERQVPWIGRMGDAYRQAAGPMQQVAARQRDLAKAADTAARSSSSFWDAADRTASQAAHSVAASAASMAGAMRGGLSAAVSGAKSAAAGIVNALGGGWNVAIAGAIAAATVITGEIAKIGKAKDLLADLQHQAADTGAALYEALADKNLGGEIDALNDRLRNLIDTQKEVADTGSGFWGSLGNTALGYLADVNPLDNGKTGRDVAAEWQSRNAAAKEAKEFSEAIEAAGISAEEAATAVGGSATQYDALISRLDLSTDGGKRAADMLAQQRDEYLALQGIVADLAPGSVELSEAMATIGDEAASSEDKVSALSKALDTMLGIDPDADQAVADLYEEIDKVTESTQQAVDAGKGFGDTLFGDKGKLDLSKQNARDLRETLYGMRESLEQVAVSGGDVSEAWEAQQPALEALAEKYGLTSEQVQDLAYDMGLIPETIESTVHVATDEAMAGLEEVYGAIVAGQVKAGEPISLDVENVDDTRDQIEALGWTVDETKTKAGPDGKGYITFTADTDQAIDDVRLLGDATAALDGDKAIHFHSDAPDQIQQIRDLGVEINDLGDGNYSISSNTADQIKLMVDLGLLVRDEKTGKVTVSSNLDDVLKKGRDLDARDGRETVETHKVITSEERRISFWESQGYSPSQAKKMQGPVPINANGSVRRAASGLLSQQAPQIAPGGSWLLWAEDETEGESFIPHARSKRARATQILAETAGIFGLSVVDQDGRRVHRNGSDVGPVPGDVTAFADGGARGATRPREMPDVPASSLPASAVGEASSSDTLDLAGALGATLQGIPEDVTTTVTLDADGVPEQLDEINTDIAAMPEAVSTGVDADTDGADKALAATSGALTALGDTTATPTADLADDALETGVANSEAAIARLDEGEALPEARLITDGLTDSVHEAEDALADLDAVTPVPEADLAHGDLDAGVDESTRELEDLGGSKATSVADVDNSSALVNIQGVMNELNKLPVERVIKVVAHGTTGLATGGKLPGHAAGGRHDGYRLPSSGPGTDREDGFLAVDTQGVPVARLDRDEWVINRASSQKYNRELDMINRGVFPKLDDLHHIEGFANGGKLGVVSPEQLLAFAGGAAVMGQRAARSLEGAPYDWGGVNWGDCSGAMSGLSRFAVGMDAFGGRFATGSEAGALAAMGFSPGLGPSDVSFNIGWFNGGPWGGHTAGTIAGVNVEMGGGRGNGQIGGPAAGAASSQFTDHAHIPLGELVAFDYMPVPMRVTAARMAAAVPSFDTTGGLGVGPGGRGVGPGGMGLSFAGVYDSGGLWPSGTWAANMSGKTERVLTHDEQADFADAARSMHAAAGAQIDAADQMTRVADELDKASMGQQVSGDALASVVGRQAADWILSNIDLRGIGGAVVSKMDVVVEAEEDLAKTRQEIADENEKLSSAESELADAQRDLAEATSGTGEASERSSEKIKDAEKAVADARADGDADKIAEAEKRLADARKDASADHEKDVEKATEAVTRAEEKVTDARKDATDQAGRLEKAERAVIAARFKAISQLVDFATKQVTGALDAVAGLFDEIAKQAGIMEQTRQQLVAERIERQAADLEARRARLDALIAEGDIARVRAQGAINIADAEAELEAAREAATLKGRTGIDAMSEALDRARVTGIFAIEDVSESAIANSAAVRAAQWKVEEARAQAAADELDAVHKQRMAVYDLAQATLTQQKAIALVDISTRQLQEQARVLGGMTSQGASRASRGWQGASQIASGVGKSVGGAAGGAALGFAVGGPVGAAIGGLIGLFSGIGDIATGAKTVDTYKKDMDESWKAMKPGDKFVTAGGLALGTGMSIAGGAATGLYGPEVGKMIAETGAEIAAGGAGYAAHAITTESEYINSRAEEERDKLKLNVQLEQAKLDKARAEEEMKFLAASTAAKADVEVKNLLSRIAEADTTKQANALADAAIVAAERRDQMLDVMENQLRAVESVQARPRQPINITLPAGREAPSREEFDSLVDTINKVQNEVDIRVNRVSGEAYLHARV